MSAKRLYEAVTASNGIEAHAVIDDIPALPPPRQTWNIRLSNSGYFPYVILTLAILSISCAGTLLRSLRDAPPLLKAFWRLFFMSAVLSIGFVVQYRQASNELIERMLSRDSLAIITISSMAASAHFGFWIWSLNNTSLAHSLFFVSTYPLVVVVWMLVSRKRIDWHEGAGIGLGLIGAALLLSDTGTVESRNDSDTRTISPSFLGDLMAFLGSAVFVVYLYCGAKIRQWLPLFLYSAPMTFLSSLPLLLLSLAIEGTTFYGLTPRSVFGFLAPSSLWVMVLIAIGPGGFGHTGVNYCVKHLSPLIISVTMTLEPVLGVVVGLIAGVEATPNSLTIIGGPISVIGTIFAIFGSHRREQREKLLQEIHAHNSSQITEADGCDDSGAREHDRRDDGVEMTHANHMRDAAESSDEDELVLTFHTSRTHDSDRSKHFGAVDSVGAIDTDDGSALCVSDHSGDHG